MKSTDSIENDVTQAKQCNQAKKGIAYSIGLVLD